MRLLTEELKEKIQEALGKLTKQIVDWERRDLPDFNRSIEIFSELQVTHLEILSIIESRDKETLKAVGKRIADWYKKGHILPIEITTLMNSLLRGEMPEEVK